MQRSSRSRTTLPRLTARWSSTEPAERQTSISVASTSRSTGPVSTRMRLTMSAAAIGSSSTSPWTDSQPYCSSSLIDEMCVAPSGVRIWSTSSSLRVRRHVGARQPRLEDEAAAQLAPVGAGVEVVPDRRRPGSATGAARARRELSRMWPRKRMTADSRRSRSPSSCSSTWVIPPETHTWPHTGCTTPYPSRVRFESCVQSHGHGSGNRTDPADFS